MAPTRQPHAGDVASHKSHDFSRKICMWLWAGTQDLKPYACVCLLTLLQNGLVVPGGNGL